MTIHPVVHVSRLKPFIRGEGGPPERYQQLTAPPPVADIEGQPAFDVECFLKERRFGRSKKQQLLVRWAGYGPAHDKWCDAWWLKKDLGAKAIRTKGANLLKHIQNYNMFRECVSHLANRKATGWDEIPNELIKCLPDNLLEAIHNITLWITARTPTVWKVSDTILLYKKGDATDPKNYRPVGLLLTIYKLWTTVITTVLANYAELHGCLSSSQEGFRRRRSTMRQLTL
ncbi:hypothetical protein N2152v2_006863 [Parachlorella kessleri]